MRFLCCALVFAFALEAVFAFTNKQREMAEFAVGELGDGYSLNRIKNVRTQVVQGTMYHVEVEVHYSIPGGIMDTFDCYMKVWEHLNSSKTIEHSECSLHVPGRC